MPSVPVALPVSKVLAAQSDGRKWNTTALGSRLGVDLMAASAAGFTVAPLITMIDRAIIENASNRATMSTSLRNSFLALLTRPHIFLTSRPFLLVFTLYTGTYLAANTLDTASSTLHNNPASKTTHGTAKFAATSTANLSLCLWKDAQFTRMFGAGTGSGAAKVVPMATYALFATRDAMTVFASFCVPPVLAKHIPDVPEEYMTQKINKLAAAQFIAPAAIQVVSTPLHLLGLDLFNRPGGGAGQSVQWSSRAAKVARDWGMSCLARIGRIVPAFGVGGVVNMNVRGKGMRALE